MKVSSLAGTKTPLRSGGACREDADERTEFRLCKKPSLR